MAERGEADEAGARELMEQSIGNAIAMYAATGAFLEGKGIDPAELDDFFGQTHAPGWADARGNLETIAYYVALNMRTFGFATEIAKGAGTATVTATWSPDHDDPDWPIAVRPALAKSPRTFEPIMRWLGVGYTWDATDEGIVMQLAEQPS